MQVCTSLQTDNHASTPPLCFLQAGCPSCRPTNSVKALKATKSKCNNDLHRRSFHINSSNRTGHHRILTDQTTVIHKCLNDKLKLLCLLQCSLRLHKFVSFTCSEKSPSIPGCWRRSTVVEHWSVAGELSLSCARPAADG